MKTFKQYLIEDEELHNKHAKALKDAGTDEKKFDSAHAAIKNLPSKHVKAIAKKYVRSGTLVRNKEEAHDEIERHFASKIYDENSHRLAKKGWSGW